MEWAGLNLQGEDLNNIAHIVLVLLGGVLYSMGLMEGRKGRAMFLAGLAVHAITLIHRGVVLGWLPVTEKHDNVSWMAFAMALAHWHYTTRERLGEVNLISLPMVVVLYVSSLAFRPLNTVTPFMHTPWFYLHTLFYSVSYGYMGMASAIGIQSLIERRPDYEPPAYRAAMAGWIAISISLCAGSIWFFVSYGTYWLWSAREMWITIMWLYWSLYLHARLMRGLRGTPARVIGAEGFAVALFAYFGVGTIIPCPPTYF